MSINIAILSVLLSSTNIISHGDIDMVSELNIVRTPITVKISGKINESAAKKFASDMDSAHATGQPIIIVEIDTYGGNLYAMNSMINTLERAKVPIVTVVTGKVMSAGVALLSCGDEGKRYATPNSTIMIHEGSTATIGKIHDIKIETEELNRLNTIMLETISKNIGTDKDYVKNMIHSLGHADWYLSPKEAKKHNIINHIGMPEYHIDITVETTVR
jgi:ATP-dependent Clp protease protease subunit